MKNEQGILLVELLMYIVIVGIFISLAIPKLTSGAKKTSTKAEMRLLVNAISLYEIEHDKLPSNLNKLKGYYKDKSYKKDAFGNPYQYDKNNRKLCGNTPNECLEF